MAAIKLRTTLVKAVTTVANATPRMKATASSRRLPRITNFLNSPSIVHLLWSSSQPNQHDTSWLRPPTEPWRSCGVELGERTSGGDELDDRDHEAHTEERHSD